MKRKRKEEKEKGLASKGHMDGHNSPNTQGTWMVKMEPPYP